MRCFAAVVAHDTLQSVPPAPAQSRTAANEAAQDGDVRVWEVMTCVLSGISVSHSRMGVIACLRTCAESEADWSFALVAAIRPLSVVWDIGLQSLVGVWRRSVCPPSRVERLLRSRRGRSGLGGQSRCSIKPHREIRETRSTHTRAARSTGRLEGYNSAADRERAAI